MNHFYYDDVNKCKVIESIYYPEPKQVQSNVIVPTNDKTNEDIIEEKSKNMNKNVKKEVKKEVKFHEENIKETIAPIFSTYYLDQKALQPSFFRKKIQSYYHENIPEKEMENVFQDELGTTLSEEKKEKLLKDFQKAKDEYEKILKKMRIVGLSECEETNIEEENENNGCLELKYSSNKCDVSAKESTYVTMPDIKYCYGKQTSNSGYHFKKPIQGISEEIVPESCISDDQYVYSDSQVSIVDLATNLPLPIEDVFNNKYKMIQSEYHTPGLNNLNGYF